MVTTCVKSSISLQSLTLNGMQISRVFLTALPPWPNNERVPLLIYRNTYDPSTHGDGASLFIKNGWTNPWTWQIFSYHHYHTITWEALLCIKGKADVQFGGDEGIRTFLEEGDLVLIPPGVVHKQLSSTRDFTLLGAYPDHEGCHTPNFDTVRSAASKQELQNILNTPDPVRCPIFGLDMPWDGGLKALYSK